MSCQNAPINSKVVPASDEFYRWDQTYVPQDYVNQCDADPAGLPPTCGATMCDEDTVENMHGGYYRGPHYRYRRALYGNRWGWNLPEYRRTIVVPTQAPTQPPSHMWWLPVGVAAALLFVILKKK